jgi:hypothetical protein
VHVTVEAISIGSAQLTSGQAAGPPDASAREESAFLQVLQALATAQDPGAAPVVATPLPAAGQADLAETAAAAHSTPDPTGEASALDQAGLLLPLTDLLAAVAPVLNQGVAQLRGEGTAEGTADTSAPEEGDADADSTDRLLAAAASSGLAAVPAEAPPAAAVPAVTGPAAGDQGRAASTTHMPGVSRVASSLGQPANAVARDAHAAGTAAAIGVRLQVAEGSPPVAAGLAHAPEAPSAVLAVLAELAAPATDTAGPGPTGEAGADRGPSVTTHAGLGRGVTAARAGGRSEVQGQALASPEPAAPAAPSAGTATVGLPAHELSEVPALRQIINVVQRMQQGGAHEVRLQLQPPELGRLLVQLRVSGSDVSVHLLAETSHAQNLIWDHLPELKAALAAQGLQTDHLAVTIGQQASAFEMGYRQPASWEEASPGPSVASLGEPGSAERARGLGPADHWHTVDYQV